MCCQDINKHLYELRFISSYSTLSTLQSAYVIGGVIVEMYPNGQKLSKQSEIIAQYFNDQWSQVGYLKTSRGGPGSFIIENQAFIIGG